MVSKCITRLKLAGGGVLTSAFSRVAQAKIRNQDDMHTRNNKVGTLRY